MKESTLELRDTKICAMLGWFKIKGSGEVGCADSIYVKQGHVFMVERKKPNKKQQAVQVDFEKFMVKNGTPYHLIDDADHEMIRTLLLKYQQEWFPDED